MFLGLLDRRSSGKALAVKADVQDSQQVEAMPVNSPEGW
jgi:hypothetical protein